MQQTHSLSFLQHLVLLTLLPTRHAEPIILADLTFTEVSNATTDHCPSLQCLEERSGHSKKRKELLAYEPAAIPAL